MRSEGARRSKQFVVFLSTGTQLRWKTLPDAISLQLLWIHKRRHKGKLQKLS
jgi:hypothetical protein